MCKAFSCTVTQGNKEVKTRRHHNNSGLRQIKRGKTYEQVKTMAKRLKKPNKSERKKLIAECLAVWALCIKARDKVCRYTNSDKGLQSHHIRSVSHHSTMFLLDNGLTLSSSVHCMQKFNPEAFQDKVIEIIGQDFYEEMKRKSLMVVDYSIADLKDIKEFLKQKLVRLKSE